MDGCGGRKGGNGSWRFSGGLEIKWDIVKKKQVSSENIKEKSGKVESRSSIKAAWKVGNIQEKAEPNGELGKLHKR